MASRSLAKSVLLATILVTAFSMLQLRVVRSVKAQSDGGGATEQRHYVAYSLRAAEASVRKAQQDHADFRQDHRLYGLGGMSRPKAIFFDSGTKDWILLGERSNDAGDLTLDDFAVALRTRFLYPDTDPGVTIEPTLPGGLAPDRPEDLDLVKRQTVSFFGSLKNTRFGQTCYDADWLMKRVELGLETLPLAHIPSMFDLIHREDRRTSPNEITSRFWLSPLLDEVPVLESQKAIFIQKTRIIVKTQTLFAERNGHIVHDPDELNALDVTSKKFAQAFTDEYDAATYDRPVLERLRGLSRLAGIAKGIVVGGWSDELHFFLKDYQPELITTPSDVDVLHNQDESLGIRLSGGVEFKNLAVRLRQGDITALLEAVLKMRPSMQALSWDFLYGDTFLPLPHDSGPAGGSQDRLAKVSDTELQWTHKAAADGDVDAMLILGEYYLRGNAGPNKDLAQAAEWYQKAAQSGNGKGMYYLGVCYRRGYGVNVDLPKAITWYRRAAEAGNSGAMYNLGCIYRDATGVQQDYRQALAWFGKAAAAGDGMAMLNTGHMYSDGMGVAKDYSEAMNWFNKALNSGEFWAANSIGMLYEDGKGVAQSYTTAMRYYLRGTNSGDPAAMNNVGVLFASGGGVPRDYTEAMKWFRKAAETQPPDDVSPSGRAQAMLNVGWSYEKGLGVDKDYRQAFEWYQRAADVAKEPPHVDRVYAEAAERVGRLYTDGLGVRQDYLEAVTWLLKAANTGDATAMFQVGLRYQQGLGVAQSRAVAVDWMTKAATAGSSAARQWLKDNGPQ